MTHAQEIHNYNYFNKRSLSLSLSLYIYIYTYRSEGIYHIVQTAPLGGKLHHPAAKFLTLSKQPLLKVWISIVAEGSAIGHCWQFSLASADRPANQQPSPANTDRKLVKCCLGPRANVIPSLFLMFH